MVDSCAGGWVVCYNFVKTMTPRKRTKEVDPCTEAQMNCYPGCGLTTYDEALGFALADSDYPDTCAKACAQGVPACQEQTGADKCNSFEEQCIATCPEALRYNGFVNYKIPVQKWCEKNCIEARDTCREILHLPFDRIDELMDEYSDLGE